MRLAEPQLGRVLDRHHALARVDVARQRVQERRLARAGAAADEEVAAAADGAREQLGQRRGERAVPDEVLRREAATAEAADRQHGPVEGERWHDHIDPRAVCV